MAKLNYKLPPDKIALYPSTPPHSCKLMVIKLPSGQVEHRNFYNLGDYVKSGDVFAVNNSKVLKARLYGRKSTGGKTEFLLLKIIKVKNNGNKIWKAFGKPASRLRGGMEISVEGSEKKNTVVKILEKKEQGLFLIETPDNILNYGHVPLPPYIIAKRDLTSADSSFYQTVFARVSGSVAAPTSSLHFTDNLVKKLNSKGTKFTSLTLHIGPGTFRPVKEKPGPENIKITEPAAKSLNNAERVITCGTTMMRTLESVHANGEFRPFEGKTDLYIKPGYKFKTRKFFLTNFHLPGTPLLKMVAAYIDNYRSGEGEKLVLDLYNRALKKDYRFLSYGDAMLFVDEEL